VLLNEQSETSQARRRRNGTVVTETSGAAIGPPSPTPTLFDIEVQDAGVVGANVE
jgi:hypothetical protein